MRVGCTVSRAPLLRFGRRLIMYVRGRVLLLVAWVYACVTVHRLRKARRSLRKELRREHLAVEAQRLVAEKAQSNFDLRYT